MRKFLYTLSLVLIVQLIVINNYCKAQWVLQQSGTTQTIYSIFPVDANTGFAGGSGGTFLKTTNGGTNWVSIDIGTTNNIYGIYFLNANTGWVVGEGGIVYKTTNGGTNWEKKTSGTTSTLYKIVFVNENIGWFTGVSSIIKKSINGGDTWVSQSAQGGENNALQFLDENTGWIAGQNGRIFKTTNGGTNWILQNSPSGSWLTHMSFINANTGWICGRDQTILKTTNGGTNWISVYPAGSKQFNSIFFVNQNNGWAVTSNKIFAKTTNGGTDWTADSLDNIGNSIRFIDETTGWISGANGVIYKTGNSTVAACPGTPTVSYGGKTYNTVLIGNQCWLKENLDVGTMVLKNQDQLNNGIVEKYCYDDDPNNCSKYGGLYQWDEAMAFATDPGAKGICPEGWHIPTLEDFQELKDSVAADGNRLKAVGQGAGSGAGTNTSGFSALLTGIKSPEYSSLNQYAYYWASTLSGSQALNMYLLNSHGNITNTVPYNKKNGMSIRCVKKIEANMTGAPCPDVPTVNYSGKTYNTVQVGTQCWLKENLDVGTMIQGTQEQTNNGVIEKYCYDNDPNNCTTYGGLYQWNEIMQYVITSGVKGICPTGWHIPTKTEFEVLVDAVGNSANSLKAIGQGSGAGAGTNTSGFSLMLAGYRGNGYIIPLGGFGYLGLTDIWSSTEKSIDAAYSLYVQNTNAITFEDRNFKNMGMSLRCIKDIGTGVSEEEYLEEIPDKYVLNQNYPNPFNPKTTINFTVPKTCLVTIKVYDELGKEVVTIANENKNVGSYSVEFNASKLASGIYYYKIEAGEFTQTKKMILLK